MGGVDMDGLADRLDAAAEASTTVHRALPLLDPPAEAFGADGAGRPGRLGRDLHTHWTAVLDARAREATDAVARLSEAADAVRLARRRYAETDELAAHRLRREA
jgi:hypothetical protein